MLAFLRGVKAMFAGPLLHVSSCNTVPAYLQTSVPAYQGSGRSIMQEGAWFIGKGVAGPDPVGKYEHCKARLLQLEKRSRVSWCERSHAIPTLQGGHSSCVAT